MNVQEVDLVMLQSEDNLISLPVLEGGKDRSPFVLRFQPRFRHPSTKRTIVLPGKVVVV